MVLRSLSLVLALYLLASTAWAQAPTREAAVRAAREGRYDEAIDSLRRLRVPGGDRRVDDDLAVVLSWAGRQDEALAVFEASGPSNAAPAYLRAAMIQAYRDRRRFADAERLAREGMALGLAERIWSRQLALVFADTGRAEEAERLLAPLLDADPQDADAWLARAYAAARGGDRFGALRSYGEARRLRPGDREAAAGIAGLLRELGGLDGAAVAAAPPPLALQADGVAARVRWGAQVVPRDPAQRFAGVDTALVELDRLTTLARAAGDAETLARLRRDRVFALRLRERWADTIAATQALRDDGVAIPPFVRQAEADALLALRLPRQARTAYGEVLAADPANRDARVGLFFAEVEDEDFSAALATVDGLAATAAPWRRFERNPVPQSNSDWLEGQILAAMARNYADMNAEAWARLEPLARGAPALGYLRSNLGAVAAARGWPRRADEEVRIAASLAPEDRSVEVAVADSAMRRREWLQARGRIASLVERFPEDPGVQRVARDLRVHDLYELRAGFRNRDERGIASGPPGSGIEVFARLYSPPIAERFRALAVVERHTARPSEGRVERNRYGLGAEWRAPDATIEAIGWANDGAVDRSGASVAANWTPNDHWSFDADAERFAADSPLRAQFYGITANALGASVGYAWHESRSAVLALRGLDFSDGNRRLLARFGWAERVVDRPHLDVTLRPELYASRNTLAGAPYFNPSRDRAASLAVDIEHVISREYERSFGQRLVASAGVYWQRGFGSGGIGGVRYEQVWRNDPFTEVRYGLEVDRRLYDRVAERATSLFLTLMQRF